MKTIIVVGPGHGLNELTNRVLTTGLSMVHPDDNNWELYPGPFGLYARHGDDAIFFKNSKWIDFYNDYVRQDVNPDDSPRDNENIGKFIKMYEEDFLVNNYPEHPMILNIYINTIDIESVVKYAATLKDVICISTDIDLTEPAMREHHLLMEYSTGAAQSVDYDKEIDLHVMCDQLYNKQCEMQQVMKVCNELDIITVSANELLRGNFDELIGIDDDRMLWNYVRDTITRYNFVNTASTNPMISQIRNMDWEEIKQLGKRT